MTDIPSDYDENTAKKTHSRIWEKGVDIRVKNKDQLNTSIGDLFSLIVGKLTESLKAKLQVLSTFQAI